MTSHAELLQARERLSVGRRFLVLRPRIVAIGALFNAVCLSSAPLAAAQKLPLGAALVMMVLAFSGEAAWLERHVLSERWLFGSLLLTLLALGVGMMLSGGISSPLLALLFAPTVVGFAAFARRAQSGLLLGVSVCVLMALAVGSLYGLMPPPTPARWGMLFVSSVMALALLALGVISLVDAHARIAFELDRMRAQVLREAEQRAASVELLGARVAHDVKNPLTAVRGLLQLVQRSSSDREQERLGVALAELDRSLEVLHGYLSWARPVRDLVLADLDARALLDDVAAVIEARALESKVQVQITGAACQVLADRQRLWDALLNLALNALSAMPNGGSLSFELQPRGEQLLLALHDTGVGMSEATLARLGQAFATGHDTGTGLGVLLARSAIEQHGGRLEYESALGRGTRVTITLPLRPGAV